MYQIFCSQYISERSNILGNQLKRFSLINISHSSEPKVLRKWTLEQPVFMDVYTEVPERFLKMFLDELKDEGWIIEKLDIENDDAIASNGVYYIIIAPLYDRKEISNLNNTKKSSHYKWRVFIYYDNFFSRHNL